VKVKEKQWNDEDEDDDEDDHDIIRMMLFLPPSVSLTCLMLFI
jgi:hypothetical protein